MKGHEAMQHDSPDLASSHDPKGSLSPDELGLGPLFWASRDAVLVGDAGGRILCWNPAAEELYGFTAEEVVGQSFEMLIPEDSREQIERLAQSIMGEPGSQPHLPAPVEMPALHRSGRKLFVEFSVSPMVVNGEFLGFATIRDCTERKRLETERDTLLENAQETVRRAEELARLKADLSSLIAHELGNPLGAMGAMIELLDRDDLTVDQRSQLLSSMRGETKLLQRLVEDIRAAASMERGEFSVGMEPVEVDELLQSVEISCHSLLADHEFQVEPAPHIRVLADQERISQVLRNLLANAAKYTPSGTCVRLRAVPLDGRVRIEVEDAGPGISPADLEHIFTKFGRGRDTSGRRIPGMGLGLFLSRQIVQRHGGDLVATSEPGIGTIFSFELQEAP
jgi:PAS domain S-box-containing protein